MVGNDFIEDGAAAKTGAEVFILTDNLINKNGDDISVFPNGDYDDLKKLANSESLKQFRARSLHPSHGKVYGSAQNPDIFLHCQNKVPVLCYTFGDFPY